MPLSPAVTPTDVQTGTHDFDAVSDDDIQAAIDQADAEIYAPAWGTRAKVAEVALARHYLVSNGAVPNSGGAGAGGGPLSGARVGEVQVTYAVPQWSAAMGIDPTLFTTKWGQQYAHLQRLACFGADVLDGTV